jgi:hypothetical protein
MLWGCRVIVRPVGYGGVSLFRGAGDVQHHVNSYFTHFFCLMIVVFFVIAGGLGRMCWA